MTEYEQLRAAIRHAYDKGMWWNAASQRTHVVNQVMQWITEDLGIEWDEGWIMRIGDREVLYDRPSTN